MAGRRDERDRQPARRLVARPRGRGRGWSTGSRTTAGPATRSPSCSTPAFAARNLAAEIAGLRAVIAPTRLTTRSPASSTRTATRARPRSRVVTSDAALARRARSVARASRAREDVPRSPQRRGDRRLTAPKASSSSSDMPGAGGDAGQRVVGDAHRHARLALRRARSKPAQQRAAARQQDALAW